MVFKNVFLDCSKYVPTSAEIYKDWKGHLKIFQLDCYVPTEVPQNIFRGSARNHGKILKS